MPGLSTKWYEANEIKSTATKYPSIFELIWIT
jgi:hypothetical protein